MIVTFDIETIPTQKPELIELIASKVKPPGTIKKVETIEKWIAEEKQNAIDEAVLKTSFDGAYGQICCIGWKFGEEPPVGAIGSESDIIGAFFDSLLTNFKPERDKIKFAGHNLLGFDLPFLFKRCVINRIKPLPVIPFNRRFDDRVYDTMVEFAGYGNTISLDALCKVLGLEGKQGMSGADVWPLYQAGEIQKIYDYCVNIDVVQEYQVYKRLTFTK